jgi:myo-inositol 2-dehydrogenase/D-chiro-inositol 1-dehydrogenase
LSRRRIGLIGAGGVATRHAAVLAALRAEVAAVSDLDVGRARTLAGAHGARAYADHRAMLEGERLDAVYVCVPPFAHGPAERDVLEVGLPLFVEKPLAADVATAEAIASLVERAGVPTATGYHWRCLDTVERAHELLAARPPRLVQASWLDRVPPVGWWCRRDRSGGQMVEQTTHVLDVLRLLAGEVLDVTAVAARTERPAFPEADVDDVATATLRFASGAVGAVVSSCLPAVRHRASLEAVADGLVVELTETELTVSDADGRRTLRATVDPREQVDRDFLAALEGDGDAVRAPYGEALRTHRLACALTRSALERRTVALA